MWKEAAAGFLGSFPWGLPVSPSLGFLMGSIHSQGHQCLVRACPAHLLIFSVWEGAGPSSFYPPWPGCSKFHFLCIRAGLETQNVSWTPSAAAFVPDNHSSLLPKAPAHIHALFGSPISIIPSLPPPSLAAPAVWASELRHSVSLCFREATDLGNETV